MGLLDSLMKGDVLDDLSGLLKENPQVMDAARSLLDPKDDSVGEGFGLQDLLGALRGGGQEDAVSSWLGAGKNLAIAPGHVSDSLDRGLLEQFAAKAGLQSDQTSSVLAGVLPKLVDALSPKGEAPDSGSLSDLLGGLFSGGRA